MNEFPAITAHLASLRRAKDLIDRDFAEAIDLETMAREAGYSRYHFTRSFRAAFGRTPREYLSWRRVERASDLLRTANLSVTEVCFLVGFSSVGTFSARFKELIGASPSDYRAREDAAAARSRIPGCFVLMWSQPQRRPVAGPQSGRSDASGACIDSSRNGSRQGEEVDHQAEPHDGLGPRSGLGQEVLHRDARVRGPE